LDSIISIYVVHTDIGTSRCCLDQVVGPDSVHFELKVLEKLYEHFGDGVGAEYAHAWEHFFLCFTSRVNIYTVFLFDEATSQVYEPFLCLAF
jgi:hypothetical protein